MRGFLSAAVEETRGRYRRDLAVVRFTREGEILAEGEYAPTEDEAKQVRQAILGAKLPKQVSSLPRMPSLPPALQKVRSAAAHREWPKVFFEFYDAAGNFLMLQHRVEKPDAPKSYLPYTYYDDNEWRQLEPEGLLPLYGQPDLKLYETVVIHEGAKAAAYCQWLRDGHSPEARELRAAHPWRDFIEYTGHVGWIGGAHAAHRTDWSPLKGIRRAYIVTDNDRAGVAAAPKIAEQLRAVTTHIQFTQEWPASFDLGDPFPPTMFKTFKNKAYFVGPSWREVAHPATFATTLWTPPGEKRPVAILRDEFAEQWLYLEEIDRLISREFPELIREEKVFNKQVRSFSHVKDTGALVVRHFHGRAVKPAYRPGAPSGLITTDTASFNLHRPTTVRPLPGADYSPWIQFLEHLVPNHTERKQVERWCATLIARPETRMKWALLLVSETQGTGKGTLGTILVELVGPHNASQPSASTVVDSNFNSWIAHKRLVVVAEMYEGHSWLAYNKLKSIVTDPEITINEKYTREYKTENWAHIFACSNDLRALKIESKDRRWFLPEVTEELWSQEQFADFHTWLKCEGYRAILQWALDYGDYVGEGENSPSTERKIQVVEDSRSVHQKAAMQLIDQVTPRNDPIAFLLSDVMSYIAEHSKEKIHDNEQRIATAMREAGAVVLDRRVKVEGKASRIVMNKACAKRVEDSASTTTISEINEFVKSCLRKPSEIASA